MADQFFNIQWSWNNKTYKNLAQAWVAAVKGGQNPGASIGVGDVEAVMSNRQKHSVVAEFGSGIYSEGGGKGGVIVPRTADALIIPVSNKYLGKLKPETIAEAQNNARKHPDILNKIKGQMPGVIGFIFRTSMKGMRPIRMVRDSMPKVEQILQNEIQAGFQRGNISRTMFAGAVNTAMAIWLREAVKRSPVLTSNLKTGWTITKFAK